MTENPVTVFLHADFSDPEEMAKAYQDLALAIDELQDRADSMESEIKELKERVAVLETTNGN